MITRRHLITGSAAVAAAAHSTAAPGAARFVGITMMPEFIQNEGIDGTLKSLIDRAGATAVTISPYVMEPAGEDTGTREPPIDAGAGKVRLLDRPLWGQRELFCRTAPSFAHDMRLFKGMRYQPAEPTELTRKQGPLIADFIREAKRRGLRVYFQVQAAIPPGYRVQFGGPKDGDRPLLPDGTAPKRRLSNNGSLASPEIRKYVFALIRDLFRVYPDIDGIRLDWPEYPPYFLDDVFLDFNPFVERFARKYKFRFEDMRRRAQTVYGLLHRESTDLSGALKDLLSDVAMGDLFALKGVIVREFLRECRYEVRLAGGRNKELIANAFPPPFNIASGLHYGSVAPHVDGVAVKLYTMHWPMMLRFWSEQVLGSKPDRAREEKVVQAFAEWMQIADARRYLMLADCRYPEPNEPHQASDRVMAEKIAVAHEALGSAKLFCLAHGYGPAVDFARRLGVAWKSSGGRVWINRYGYLSDEKLALVKKVCR